ncbi:MAG: GAF domain-containing protein [Bacteroidetes bacterium]|nr:MAG: GAF domain-containing protein [Bacteroidota bacterium]TAG95675.1 MAG: GAF domain-containing protein [Bacteroidota bacterium]
MKFSIISIQKLTNFRSLKYWGIVAMFLWLILLPFSWFLAQKTTQVQYSSNELYTKILFPLIDNIRITQTSTIESMELLQSIVYKRSQSEDIKLIQARIQKMWTNTILPHLDSIEKYAQKSKQEAIIEASHQNSRKIRQIYRILQTTFKTIQETKPIILENISGKVKIYHYPAFANTFQTQVKPLFENVLVSSSELNEKINIYNNTQIFSTQTQHQLWFWLGLVCALFATFISVLIGYILYIKTKKDIQNIENYTEDLLKGNIPDKKPAYWNEFEKISLQFNQFNYELNEIKNFTDEVKKGEFEHDFKIFDEQGILGKSFADMREGLKNIFIENSIRDWANEGLAKFGQIIAKYSDDLNTLADEIMKELVNYLEINQGGFFVVEGEKKFEKLYLKATYAYTKKKFLEKEIEKGQGLLGQAWQEGETIYLREIPDDYVLITSGLGEAKPKSLLIVPFKNNQEILGLFELASFQEIKPYQIKFIQKVAESLAQFISNVHTKKVF